MIRALRFAFFMLVCDFCNTLLNFFFNKVEELLLGEGRVSGKLSGGNAYKSWFTSFIETFYKGKYSFSSGIDIAVIVLL